MKKSLATLLSMLALVLLFVAGCAKDSGTGPDDEQAPVGVSNEQQARAYFATNDEFVKNDEQTIADLEIQPTDYELFGKVEAGITPLRWGRFITRVVHTIRDTVMPGDTIAVVHVHKDISGILKIRAINANGDTVLIEKPFLDQADRKIIFRRIDRNTRRFWRNWIPVATSLVDGGTRNNEIDITKIQLFARGDSITITDPLNYFLRYRWLRHFYHWTKDVPELSAGDVVRLEVTLVSASPDTDLVALRHGFGPRHGRRTRMVLVSETLLGNGMYERVFEKTWTPLGRPGFFHAAVDAMTKATLFDDAPTSYSVSWWGVPYRVF